MSEPATKRNIDPSLLLEGDPVTDFRGKEWVFVRMEGHKVIVRPLEGRGNEQSFYAGVMGIRDPRLSDE